MATKNADPSPALLVVNRHEGLSHFAYEKIPSAGPGKPPILDFVTLVHGINAPTMPPEVTQTPAEFFVGKDLVVSPSADRLVEMCFDRAVNGQPKLIAHAQSVPALRLLAQICPQFAADVEARIQFLRG